MVRSLRWGILLALVVLSFFQTIPATKAATIDSLNVTCRRTVVRGKIEVPAPYVRVQVVLASDLNQTLASDVFSVRRDGAYTARLRYPRQPEGTLLIIAIGEWDGQQYVRPATTTSQTCSGEGLPQPTPLWPPTPTPILPPATPTQPWMPPTPTPIWPPASPTPISPLPPTPVWTFPPPTMPPTPPPAVTETWNVTTRLTGDTCGGASQETTFMATITWDGSGNFYLQRFDLIYFLYPAITHSGYIGQLSLGDASYTLDLFFTGSNTFTAYEGVNFASNPGCYWSFEWTGTRLS